MPTSSTPEAPAENEADVEVPEAAPEKKIDLQALAERVVALLKKELWVERERLGRT